MLCLSTGNFTDFSLNDKSYIILSIMIIIPGHSWVRNNTFHVVAIPANELRNNWPWYYKPKQTHAHNHTPLPTALHTPSQKLSLHSVTLLSVTDKSHSMLGFKSRYILAHLDIRFELLRFDSKDCDLTWNLIWSFLRFDLKKRFKYRHISCLLTDAKWNAWTTKTLLHQMRFNAENALY